MELEEARKLLLISKNNLDEACQTQADIFYEVAEEVAFANSHRDYMKEQLVKRDAELAVDIRKKSEQSGEKLTETKLQQMLQTHPEHLKTFDEWLEAKLNAERWSALKDSFLQRASMIKELCALFISGYYADIEVKGNKDTDEYEVQKIREKQAEKRRQKSEK